MMKNINLLVAVIGIFITIQTNGQEIQAPKPPGQTTNIQEKNNCESGNCENGWGKKIYDHGYYEGFFKNGNRHGYGLFDWTDSGDYIGFWNNDKMHGYGCYLGEKKDLIGQYVEGSLHGFGHTREIETDKWVYGLFQSYLLKEEHTFYDNNITVGCVAGDCQSKYGRYKWDNGDSFTGFFKDGNMFMGTYNFADGGSYEGMFNSSNQFHGQGRYFFGDDGYYGGEWNKGKRDGIGYYHDKDYVRQIGIWNNDTFVKDLN